MSLCSADYLSKNLRTCLYRFLCFFLSKIPSCTFPFLAALWILICAISVRLLVPAWTPHLHIVSTRYLMAKGWRPHGTHFPYFYSLSITVLHCLCFIIMVVFRGRIIFIWVTLSWPEAESWSDFTFPCSYSCICLHNLLKLEAPQGQIQCIIHLCFSSRVYTQPICYLLCYYLIWLNI